MSSASTENRGEIARNALAEFLSPIYKLTSFARYVFSAKSRHDEIIGMIHKVESNSEIQQANYVEFVELCNRLGSAISKQEKMLLGLKKELVDTQGLFHGQRLHTGVLGSDTHAISDRIARLIDRAWELQTSKLTHGGKLSNAAAEVGLASIEVLLKGISSNENSTPYLFGINKGGAFLANYLAHRIDLHQKYLVKCDTTEFKKIICEERDIDGPIVIIDDVTRTGATMSRIKQYVKNRYPTSNVFSVALVKVCSELEASEGVSDIVDYSPWYTVDHSVTLPWSIEPGDEIESIGDALESADYFDEIEMDQIVCRISPSSQ